MPPPEFHQILPTISVWHAYDSSVKAELFSTGVLTPSGLYIVDPTRLPEDHGTPILSSATDRLRQLLETK